MVLTARVGGLVACALGLLVSGRSFAADGTGEIRGRVTAPDGSGIGGAQVTAIGAAGALRSAASDAGGDFTIPDLAPGTYAVECERRGFRGARVERLSVGPGRVTEATFTLAIAGAEERVSIRAAAPPLPDPKTPAREVFLDAAALEWTPSARDPWAIARDAIGVQTDRINAGGQESGRQALLIADGAPTSQNVWILNGVSITDLSKAGNSPLFYDFDSFSEVRLSVGGSDVTAATAGLQLNLVTRRGTNQWHGSARFYDADRRWSSDNRPVTESNGTPTQQVLGAHPGNHLQDSREYGAELGGPILADRVWAWGSASRFHVNVRSQLDATDLSDLTNENVRVNAQPSGALSVDALWTAGAQERRGLDVSAIRAPETGLIQRGPGGRPVQLWLGRASWILTERTQLIGSYSYLAGGYEQIPAGGTGAAPVYRDVNHVFHGSYQSNRSDRPQHQADLSALAAVRAFGLDHDLRAGGSYRRVSDTTVFAWPADRVWIDYGAGPFGPLAYVNRDDALHSRIDSSALWVSDSVTRDRLTVTAGARYDWQSGRNLGIRVPANPLVPEIVPSSTTTDQPAAFHWRDASPRLGVAYAFGDRGRVVARGSYARFTQQLTMETVQFGSPSQGGDIIFFWKDGNGDGIVQRSELDFTRGTQTCGPYRCYGFGGFDPANPSAPAVSPDRIDPALSSPRTDELRAELEWAAGSDVLVGVSGVSRTAKRFLSTRPIGATRSDYVLAQTLTGVLFDGTPYSAPYYEAPGTDFTTGSVLTNRPDYRATYRAVTLDLQKRWSRGWMARAHFTWQDWRQRSGPNGCVDPTNYEQQIGGASCPGSDAMVEESLQARDKFQVYVNARWQFSVTGMWQLPFGVRGAVSFFGREGYPYLQEVSGPAGGAIIVTKLDRYRYDDIYSLDLVLDRDFRVGPAVASLSLACFNIANSAAVTQRFGFVDFPQQYGAIREIQSPRVLRVGARVSF